MALSATECFEQAAEQLRKAEVEDDRLSPETRASLSESWRLLGLSVRGEEPATHVDATGQVERAEQFDHDWRSPVGFGAELAPRIR